MMFLFLSICPAGEDTDQGDCLAWDAHPSVCPADPTTTTLGERARDIGEKIVDSRKRRQGACWDFVNVVYTCAGYPEKLREIAWPPEKKCDQNGPYLKDMDIIQPGDWIMHNNLEYLQRKGIEHSAIFVCWINEKQMSAKTLDYRGENKCEAGHYSEHTLTQVWRIVRAKRCEEQAVK
jgi:hypothetical protein